MTDALYAFLARGLLVEEALDRAGRESPTKRNPHEDQKIADSLSLTLLDEENLISARRMATVYIAIAAFENGVRDLVQDVLVEVRGENWWSEAVSANIRERAEKRRDEEAKTRWHARRGDRLLNYTEFGDLLSIMSQNWAVFEPHIRSIDWARHIITTLERSRNVIMHSGTLDSDDIDRIGIHIRDWARQVGA